MLSKIDKQVEVLMHKLPSDDKVTKIKKLNHQRSSVLARYFGNSG